MHSNNHRERDIAGAFSDPVFLRLVIGLVVLPNRVVDMTISRRNAVSMRAAWVIERL